MGDGFAMNGGDGTYSYTKNSHYQKEASDSVKGMMEEAVISKLDVEKLLSISSTLTIADLGCSVGPNTFFTVQNLMKAVENKCSHSNSKTCIEFNVLFNDQSSNDFNTLFASLPPERQYYAAGVPGSFQGRLFPRGSISVFHSSYALQWLSKVQLPHEFMNEGRVHYTGAPNEVVRAYSDQFEKDMGVFVSARAEEMVRGGLMFLIMPGIPDGLSHSDSHTPSAVLFNFLGYSLMELANEGVVEKSAVDAFNLPIYAPTVGEMRKVIEGNGCFSIETMELTNPRSQVGALDVVSLIKHLRAGMEGILTPHFGKSVVDKMFIKISEKDQEMWRCLEACNHTSTQLFLVLKRN
ncbi:hypothetical protein C2S51_035658 [Perilla frutescens var. frutescens]|nr:hypothetical protein C2S51_035658 [Perilla frutescens var. frutescens]